MPGSSGREAVNEADEGGRNNDSTSPVAGAVPAREVAATGFLVAYGAGAILAGAVTHAMSLGDDWSLLGSSGGVLIAAGALRLVRRTFAMKARVAEELEFHRLVLGIASLAALLGASLFMMSIARWQTDVVPATFLATGGAAGVVNLAVAWRAVLRLASYFRAPTQSRARQARRGRRAGRRMMRTEQAPLIRVAPSSTEASPAGIEAERTA